MKLYGIAISLTGEELCVAASSVDHAAEIFVTFWIASSGSAPGKFAITGGVPAAYQDNVTVNLIGQGDVAGVIVRQTDGSMLFEPTMGR